ncbi:MAG: hypothetical protein HYX78_02560 [Armatimonadetes bacterium]|nr:hypothetical protein [Armatimonadota bacterium]
MKLKRLAVVAIVLAAVGAAGFLLRPTVRADATAELRQAYKASRSQSYTATVTNTLFYCGREYRTRSRVQRKGTLERIEYLSGPMEGAVVVASGAVAGPRGRADSPAPVGSVRDANKNIDLLLENYRACKLGRGTVAGRPVDIIELAPRYRGNPSKRLWVDRVTKVVLKSEDWSAQGRLRSRTEFTDVNYDVHLLDAVFKKSSTGANLASFGDGPDLNRAEIEKAVGIRISFPAYLPTGYVLHGIRVYDCGCCTCGHRSAHLRYINGLNSISIFETPASHNCGGGKCSVHCPSDGRCEVRNANQANVAIAARSDKTVIVVADLPKEQLTKIVESVR